MKAGSAEMSRGSSPTLCTVTWVGLPSPPNHGSSTTRYPSLPSTRTRFSSLSRTPVLTWAVIPQSKKSVATDHSSTPVSPT